MANAKTKRTSTSKEICEQLDVDPRTVSRWVKRGCPSTGKGASRRFDIPEVAAWMKANNLTGEKGKPSELTGPLGEQIKAAKLRKELALAEKHEIAVAQEKGLLVQASKVEKENIQKFTTIRNRLLTLPAASSFLVGKSAVEIERELETRIKEILADLSRS